MARALITAVHGGKDWDGVRRLVKEDKRCPHDNLEFFADMGLFSEPIPMKLAVTVERNIVARAEILDLGTAKYGMRIAAQSNGMVTPGYRHHGIWKALITLMNLIVDRTDFFFVVGRLITGYEQSYMSVCPGFTCVREEDSQGAAWVLRPVRMRSYTGDMLQAAIEHLEKVRKW